MQCVRRPVNLKATGRMLPPLPPPNDQLPFHASGAAHSRTRPSSQAFALPRTHSRVLKTQAGVPGLASNRHATGPLAAAAAPARSERGGRAADRARQFEQCCPPSPLPAIHCDMRPPATRCAHPNPPRPRAPRAPLPPRAAAIITAVGLAATQLLLQPPSQPAAQ